MNEASSTRLPQRLARLFIRTHKDKMPSPFEEAQLGARQLLDEIIGPIPGGKDALGPMSKYNLDQNLYLLRSSVLNGAFREVVPLLATFQRYGNELGDELALSFLSQVLVMEALKQPNGDQVEVRTNLLERITTAQINIAQARRLK